MSINGLDLFIQLSLFHFKWIPSKVQCSSHNCLKVIFIGGTWSWKPCFRPWMLGEHGKNYWAWSASWERAHEPGFSSGAKSSWRPKNCSFLAFALPHVCACAMAPLPLLKGYIIRQISTQAFLPLHCALKLLDFHTRTVYSGSHWIWSAELSWVWRVFLTLGLLFLVLNILLQLHPALCKTNSWKHCSLLLLECVTPTVTPTCSLESHRHGASCWKGRFLFMSQDPSGACRVPASLCP